MNRNLRDILLLGATAVSIGAALVAMTVRKPAPENFTPRQEKEIGQIVRSYLMEHPDILIDMSRKLEKQKRAREAEAAAAGLAQNKDKIYHAKGDLIAGNPEGKVAMVEFFDYNCGFCKRALPDVLKLQDTNKDLKVIIKEFPILGPGSMEAARYAIASRKQGMDKYWAFHVAMMKHKGQVNGKVALALAEKTGLDVDKLKEDARSKEVDEIINRNMELATKLNINGTPAFIIGDDIIPGALGYKVLNGIIAKVRKDGCKHC